MGFKDVCDGRDSVRGKSIHTPGKGVVCLMNGVHYGRRGYNGGKGGLKWGMNPFRVLPNSPRPAVSPSQPHGK